MWGILSGLFKDSGAITSLEKVALEWIDTDKESAEAKTLMVKALDKNGKMRRELSTFASRAYGFYLFNTTILLYLVAFNVGDVDGAKEASKMMADLFLPITTSWAAIVSASFGVNATNSIKGSTDGR